MNIQTPITERKPSRDEAEAALAVLRQWAGKSSDAEIATLDASVALLVPGNGYPALRRDYPDAFEVDEAYKATLPDLQNGPSSLIKGAKTQIQHVGISNFRLPIRYHTRDNGDLLLETSVTGTVSLEAEKKGINMSRIMRSFYAHAERSFSFEVIEAALDDYKRDLESFDARIQMRFSFPVRVQSLRSGLSGWQYYDIALELVDKAGVRKKIMHLDYVYSSTCPCSLELSEHARRERGQLATPHSQRSVARISVEVVGDGLPVVRGSDRPCPRRCADRDAGDGQARGRTGLCRVERRQPDLRRGRRAQLLRGLAARPARGRLPHRGKPSGIAPQPRRGKPLDPGRNLRGRKPRSPAFRLADPRRVRPHPCPAPAPA